MTPRPGPLAPRQHSALAAPRPELALAGLLAARACATAPPAAAGGGERARPPRPTWSGSLRVSVSGPDVRGRSRVAAGVPPARRRCASRCPAPRARASWRWLATGAWPRSCPAERAFLEARPRPRTWRRCWASRSTPARADGPAGGRGARAPARATRRSWGSALPRRVAALLPDGARLVATVEDAEADAELAEAGLRSRRRTPATARSTPTRRAGSGEALMPADARLRVPSRRSTSASRCWACATTATTSCARSSRRSTSTTTSCSAPAAPRRRASAATTPGCPRTRRNLAAAGRPCPAALRPACRAGSRSTITKRIPVGGGLGGGSSNAAAVLLALDRLWRLGLGPDGLHPLARRLGADVPFFLVGGTALGLARGDEVYPLGQQVRAHVVVVDPGVPVSTARSSPPRRGFDTPRKQ